MDFGVTPEHGVFREKVRAFCDREMGTRRDFGWLLCDRVGPGYPFEGGA